MKTTQPRQPGRGKPRRLAASAAFGAAVAGTLVAWTDLHNHAALVASAAAAPEPKGVHETVGSILATGGIFTFLAVTLAAFVVVSVLGRLRGTRAAATVPLYPPARPRRRSRASARW